MSQPNGQQVVSAAEISPMYEQLRYIAAKAPSMDTLLGDLVISPVGHDQAIETAAELPREDTEVSPGIRTANELVSAEEAATLFETEGVVKEAPRFSEQILDDDRRTPFHYAKPYSSSYKRLPSKPTLPLPKLDGSVTEINGLRETHSMLTRFLAHKSGKPRMDRGGKINSHEQGLVEQARDMLENLTFIGEGEMEEAVRGLGASWRAYLDEDPERKICVLTEVNQLNRYKGTRKSDDYVRERILDTFSDEELEHYSGRIVGNLSGIEGVNPQKARVILLDDWAISGRQMRDSYNKLMRDPRFRAFSNVGKVEINLLVASADRIENGLPIIPEDPDSGALRVRAYFQSHNASTAHQAHSSYVTGLHSPVNFGFGETCKAIAKKTRGLGRSPRLIRILPSYPDTESSIRITDDSLERAVAIEVGASDGRATTDYAVGKLATEASEAGE
ncbi:MAG: hypothetical protein WD885_03325 [Candidatus Saccharimonadales bacterium]